MDGCERKVRSRRVVDCWSKAWASEERTEEKLEGK